MIDQKIRLYVFDWLKSQVEIYGDSLPRKLLATGVQIDNVRVPLVAPQGIFIPKVCELPLTITTTPGGPYDDALNYSDRVLSYKYRGTDPLHRENVGLRKLMETKTPLIYFLGLVPGKYMASWPAYVIGDDPGNLTFKVVVDTELSLQKETETYLSEIREIRRSYVTAQVKVRVHQNYFREKVLKAYKNQCAFCRLKHEELLDAAHIVPDADPQGKPTVNNGIALCKIHHAAFDKFFIGVSSDFKIHVRNDIMLEMDGPMLKFGLQAMNNKILQLPNSKTDWPNPEFLENRFNKFISHL